MCNQQSSEDDQCFSLIPGYPVFATAHVDQGTCNFTVLQAYREERHCKKDLLLGQRYLGVDTEALKSRFPSLTPQYTTIFLNKYYKIPGLLSYFIFLSLCPMTLYICSYLSLLSFPALCHNLCKIM